MSSGEAQMEGSVLLPTEGKLITAGSQTMRLLQRGDVTGYALIEVTMAPAMPGPPLHMHRQTDEAFFVLEGTFGIQAGEQTITAPSGAYVFVPRGLAHTYWNQGAAPAKVLIVISPPGFAAYFEALSERLAAAGDTADAAISVRRALSAQFDIEVLGQPRQAP